MNILILGGTGAMGTMLVSLLAKESKNNFITITSRSERKSEYSNVTYIKGDAKDTDFLKKVLSDYYDVVIDFMKYGTAEFKERYQLLLSNTDQYVFISSARVYAQSDVPITENTPRLLDTVDDPEYLKTDEYALAKARCEDLLNNSGKKNYTIVRPSITYGNERLQLGVLEKEGWLYRALHGRSIVFSNDIGPKYTAMTTGEDVSRGIVSLLGKPEAYGETFQITSEKSYTWNEILSCYLKVLEKEKGLKPKVVYTEKAINLKINKYQVIYCRYFNRRFDDTKIKQFIDTDTFKDPMDGLEECLKAFLKKPRFKSINWKLEAWNDRAAGERTPLKEIPGRKQKVYYLLYRYKLDFVADAYNRLKGK